MGAEGDRLDQLDTPVAPLSAHPDKWQGAVAEDKQREHPPGVGSPGKQCWCKEEEHYQCLSQ